MQQPQKRTIYIGGLPEEVDDKILYNTFLPFGPILEVNVPPDYNSKESKHRGFGFVEFESAEDAAAAVDNMDESELFGRTIRVNLARPKQIKEGWGRPVWSEDKWLVKHAGETLPVDGEQNKPPNTNGGGTDPSNIPAPAIGKEPMDVQS